MKTREMVDFHCRVISTYVRAWNLCAQIKETMYEVSRVNVKVEPCITSILFAGVNFKRVSTQKNATVEIHF